MTVLFFANRDVEHPKNDEHAGMAHVSIAKSESFDEVKQALVHYMNEEVVWLAKSLDYRETSGWPLDRIRAIQDAVVKIAQWQETGFGFDPGNWTERKIITDGIVWQMVRVEN